MKLNNLIDLIYKLDIKEDEYEIYKELINYPQNIFNIVIINIVLGNLKPYDLKDILSKYRKLVFTEGITIPTDTISNKLKNKFNHNITTEVLEKQDSLLEQSFLAELYKNFKGVNISENEIPNIFVTNNNYEKYTLNYDDIILQRRDYVYMDEHNLNEITMKKMKLLEYYIALKLNTKGDIEYYGSK